MSSDGKEAYSLVILSSNLHLHKSFVLFFSRLKELTFKKYCYVSSSVIGLSPLKQEFNNVKWTIIELKITWLTVIINLKKLKCTQKLIRSMKQKILKRGSYDQGEIMMFDDCKSKNMPGQFTTAHLSGCGYLYKHCRFEMKDLNLSTRPFDAATKPLHTTACSNNWRNHHL